MRAIDQCLKLYLTQLERDANRTRNVSKTMTRFAEENDQDIRSSEEADTVEFSYNTFPRLNFAPILPAAQIHLQFPGQ
jgi:hypothetical protein